MKLKVPKMPRIKMKDAASWAAAGAGFFVAMNLAVSIYVELLLARPKRKRSKTADLSDFVPEVNYQTAEIRFPSNDGFDLCALLMTPEKTNGHIIVICHGLAHDKRSGVRFVQYLLREGYTLLAIDFRNHGDSEGDVTTYGYFEKRDLHAAIQYLRKTFGSAPRIGVLGASMGASIALQAAAETDELSALVLDSPFASLKTITYEWADQKTHMPRLLLHVPMHLGYFLYELYTNCRVLEIEPVEKVKKLSCPIFLIHGAKDDKIPAHHSREIFENATGEKELWIAKDAGHLGTYLYYRHEYETRVLQFFKKTLRREDTKIAQTN